MSKTRDLTNIEYLNSRVKDGTLKIIYLTDEELKKHIIPFIQSRPDISSVKFIYSKLTSAGAALLLKLPSVTTINLSDSNSIDDSICEEAANTPHLRSLHIGECKLTKQGLMKLANSPYLNTLNITRYNLDAEICQALADNSVLTSLNIAKCTGAAIDILCNNKTITALVMACIKLTDADCRALANNRLIKHLDLYGTDINAAKLDTILTMQQLEYLNVEWNNVGEYGLDASGTTSTSIEIPAFTNIAALQNLKTLVASMNWVTLNNIRNIAKSTSLQSISINSNDGDKALAVLKEMPNLKRLEFQGCLRIENGKPVNLSGPGRKEFKRLGRAGMFATIPQPQAECGSAANKAFSRSIK